MKRFSHCVNTCLVGCHIRQNNANGKDTTKNILVICVAIIVKNSDKHTDINDTIITSAIKNAIILSPMFNHPSQLLSHSRP